MLVDPTLQGQTPFDHGQIFTFASPVYQQTPADAVIGGGLIRTQETTSSPSGNLSPPIRPIARARVRRRDEIRHLNSKLVLSVTLSGDFHFATFRDLYPDALESMYQASALSLMLVALQSGVGGSESSSREGEHGADDPAVRQGIPKMIGTKKRDQFGSDFMITRNRRCTLCGASQARNAAEVA